MPVVLIDLSGPALTADERELIAGEPVAGLCLFSRNLVDRDQARDLIEEAREAAGDRPFLVTIDQEGGSVVRLLDGPVPPAAMALGAIDDEETTLSVAEAVGRSLRSVGVDVDLAPVADVAVNPDNPVIADRAFGADPELVARHVAAFVRGLQRQGVAATVKHFPGHGDVDVDSHLDLPTLQVDRRRLESVEWPPFRAGIAAGAAAALTAHLMVPALDPERPATLSAPILQELRTSLSFDGVIFSDALDMRAIADRWSPADAAILALEAGVDAPLRVGPPHEHRSVVRAVDAAVAEGRLDPDRIARSEARIAALARRFPPAAPPHGPVPEEDLLLMARTARRAVTALGDLPRLPEGGAVVVVGAESVPAGAAADAVARPARTLADALREAGHPVREVVAPTGGGWDRAFAAQDPAPLEPAALDPAPLDPAALAGAAMLVVVSGTRTPLSGAELGSAWTAFESARAAGVPAVHAAMWNPVHAARLPGPALLTYGFRPDAARAVVQALRTGRATGRAPIPLEIGRRPPTR